jgi:hypothetical protein
MAREGSGRVVHPIFRAQPGIIERFLDGRQGRAQDPSRSDAGCAWNSGPVLQRRAGHRRRWSEQALPYFVSSTRRVA